MGGDGGTAGSTTMLLLMFAESTWFWMYKYTLLVQKPTLYVSSWLSSLKSYLRQRVHEQNDDYLVQEA